MMKFFTTTVSLLLILSLSNCSTINSEYKDNSNFDITSKLQGNAPDFVSVIKVTKKSEMSKNEVQGICYLVTEKDFNLESPCVRTELNLKDSGGNIQLSTKTNDNGVFKFVNLKKMTRYKVEVSNTKYKTLSDQIYVTPGAKFLIRIIEK